MLKPNLLFLYTDEQAVGTMAAYGNNRIQTPNMDRLASQGVVFERAYVSQPVCTPSRSTILTGLYPHTNGCTQNNIRLGEEVLCLPELGDFSDYHAAHFGKWHLGDELFAQHNFAEWVSIEDGYIMSYGPGRDPKANCSYYHWLLQQGFTPNTSTAGIRCFDRGFCARLPEQFSKPAFLAQEASRFIRENKDCPFILYVNFLEPHPPFFGPRDGQYNPDEVPLPPNFQDVPGPEQPLKVRLLREFYRGDEGAHGSPLPSEADWRRLIARYWGLCSQVDAYMGRILDTLVEYGLESNTVVVFTSDHGDMMGSHRLVGKCVQYEEAVRVPLVIRSPWLKGAPRRVATPVSQVDLVPTLLDQLGQPIPSHLQGRSWLPYLEGGGPFPGEDVFIEWNGPDSGIEITAQHAAKLGISPEAAQSALWDPVRTIVSPEGWKLNCSPLGEHELYNLQEAPFETRNLIRDPSTRSLVRSLYERIISWQERVNDPVDLSRCRFP
jgi:arylsulfatase A-like enzyme